MKTKKSTSLDLPYRIATIFALIGMVLLSPPGWKSAFAADNLCVPDHATASTSIGVSNIPPQIDGNTLNDPGWRQASQYAFEGPPEKPHARVQLDRSSNELFLAFEVNNDPTFDDDDTIVLILQPDINNRADDRRFVIYPVRTNLGGQSDVPPREVKYWRGSNGWNSAPAQTKPSWLYDASGYKNIRVKTSSCQSIGPCNGSDVNASSYWKSYWVEMRIPIHPTDPDQGVNIPTNNNFGLYFDIVRVQNLQGSGTIPVPSAEELYWPPSPIAPPIATPTLPAVYGVETNTIDWQTVTTTWPKAQPVGICPGVTVTNVETNYGGGHTTYIDPNSTNNLFYIDVENSGSADAQVNAYIKSAQFGIAGVKAFDSIPPHTATPTKLVSKMTGNVNGKARLEYGPWDATQLTNPNDPTLESLKGTHVCSFVELNAVGGLIANRYKYWNLWVAQSSRFQGDAVIDASGFTPSSDENEQTGQTFYLSLHSREQVIKRERQPSVTETSNATVESVSAGFKSPVTTLTGTVAEGRVAKDRTTGSEEYKLPWASDEKVAPYFWKLLLKLLAYNDVISTSEFTICGHLRTNKNIVINGHVYPVRISTPCYTYFNYHKGRVVDWVRTITGPGIADVKGQSGWLTAKVPFQKSTTATATIDAKELVIDKGCGSLDPFQIALAVIVLFIIMIVFWVTRTKKP